MKKEKIHRHGLRSCLDARNEEQFFFSFFFRFVNFVCTHFSHRLFLFIGSPIPNGETEQKKKHLKEKEKKE